MTINDDTAAAGYPAISSAPSLLRGVLDTIGTEIASGAMAPGQRFRLNDICERFDISRTVAREAMRALEQLGMLRSSRRVGLTVEPASAWNVFDPRIVSWRLSHNRSRQAQVTSLNQLRLGIEPVAARLAAHHATDAQRTELNALATRIRELEEIPSQRVGEELETDLRFHALILEASGNEFFAALAPMLLSVSKGKSVYGSRKRDPISGTVDLHIKLATAISHGLADEAEATARVILEETRPAPS